MKSKVLLTIVCLIVSSAAYSQNATDVEDHRIRLGNVPPTMGWEPWYINLCNVSKTKADAIIFNEAYYKKLIDYFVSSGLRDLGYKYLVVECDDHYRDENGQWQVNKEMFPNGYEGLTRYAHERGMKIKGYTDAGKGKCCCFKGGGSFGYYEEDAKAWERFGFDGIKIDWCGGDAEKLDPKTQYLEFYEAMKKHITRPFDVEICCWGLGKTWEWGRFAGTMWRTHWDGGCDEDPNLTFEADGSYHIGGYWQTTVKTFKKNRQFSDPKFVGPGKGYNYPDIVLIGLPGGLTEVEERTQFSLWAMMASPLYLGCDLLTAPQYALDIVTNIEIIAIDQDPLGIQGGLLKELNGGMVELWVKPLEGGSKAIALLNLDKVEHTVTIGNEDIGVDGLWHVRDLWEHKEKGEFKALKATIRPHETLVFKVYKK